MPLSLVDLQSKCLSRKSSKSNLTKKTKHLFLNFANLLSLSYWFSFSLFPTLRTRFDSNIFNRNIQLNIFNPFNHQQYRAKLNEKINEDLLLKQQQIDQRTTELSNIDQRISELKSRLNRKRTLNEQLNAQMKSHLLKAESTNNQSNAFNDNLNNENDVPNCNSILKANLRRSIGAGQPSSRFGVALRPFNAVEPLKRQPKSEFDLTSVAASSAASTLPDQTARPPAYSNCNNLAANPTRIAAKSSAKSSTKCNNIQSNLQSNIQCAIQFNTSSNTKRTANQPTSQPNVDKSNQLNASSPSLVRTATRQAAINYAGQQAAVSSEKSAALNRSNGRTESNGTNLITAINANSDCNNPHLAVGQRLPDSAPPGHPSANQLEQPFQFSPFDQKEFNFSQNLPNQRINAINNTAKYKIVDRGQNELPGDHSDQSKLSEQINQSSKPTNNSFVTGQNENLAHHLHLNNSSNLNNSQSNLNGSNLSNNLSNNLNNLSNKLSVNPNIHQNPHLNTHANGLNILSSAEPNQPVNVSPALSSASSSALSDFVPSASSSVTDLTYQTKSTSSTCRYVFYWLTRKKRPPFLYKQALLFKLQNLQSVFFHQNLD